MKNAIATRPEPWLISDDELARLSGVSKRTIANWRKDEGLPSVKIGGVRRFDPAAVRRWIESRQK